MPNKAQEAYGTPNRQGQKRNSLHHVIEHPMHKTKAIEKTRKRSSLTQRQAHQNNSTFSYRD